MGTVKDYRSATTGLAEIRQDGRIRIIRRITSAASASSAMAFVGAGSWFDPAGRSGLAHLYEHAFFAGAGRYPTAVSMATAIADLGCQFNAHTYRDHSYYYISGPGTTAGQALDLLLTCYLAPRFEAGELRKQQAAIHNELRSYADNRERRLRDLTARALYGPVLGSSPLGDSVDIASLAGDDLRWYARHAAVPERVTVVIDGPAGPIAETEIIDKHLGNLPEGGQLSTVPVTYGPRLNIHLAAESQLALGALVVPGVSYELSRREMYAMRLFHTAFGGGPSSRLITLLRDQMGVSYQARTTLEPHATTGALLVIFGCAMQALHRVVGHVHDLLRQLLDESITRNELARAQEINRGIHVRERETSVGRCMLTAHDLFRRGEPGAEQDAFDLWADVGIDEVTQVARRHLRLDDARFALVAPESAHHEITTLPFLSPGWEQA